MTKCSAKPRVGRRKRYCYIKRLTIVYLVSVLSVNMWRVKEKSNEARKTSEEYDKVREIEGWKNSIWIARNNPKD